MGRRDNEMVNGQVIELEYAAQQFILSAHAPTMLQKERKQSKKDLDAAVKRLAELAEGI